METGDTELVKFVETVETEETIETVETEKTVEIDRLRIWKNMSLLTESLINWKHKMQAHPKIVEDGSLGIDSER